MLDTEKQRPAPRLIPLGAIRQQIDQAARLAGETPISRQIYIPETNRWTARKRASALSRSICASCDRRKW
jgi:hypothetical protein